MEEVSGRVREVERLLQVVTVLRTGDGYPVSRTTLLERVPEYRNSSADAESVKRMMANDRIRLAQIGFQVEDVAGDGEVSAFVLRDAAWRLPLDLEPREESLLVWVMAAAGAMSAEATAADGGSGPVVGDLSGLLGSVPRGFDLAQAALAGRRALVIERDGNDVEFEPALLASRDGRWFLLGRYEGQQGIKAPRLDRLIVLALGRPMSDPPYVEDPELYLDQTAWDYHDERIAVLRCQTTDRSALTSWFSRAVAQDHSDGTTTFTLPYRHEQALVTRVIGQSGAVWIEEPPSAVAALRQQVSAVLDAAS